MWGFKQKQWRLLVDNPDLLSFELSQKEMRVRIEARRNEEDTWTIFRTYLDDSSSALTYTEEFHTQTRDEAEKIISSLQKNKLLTKKEISQQKELQAKKLPVKVKRHFKDYNVEKWIFAVAENKYENVVYIRDAEIIEVNIIMHEKYRHLEANILHELKTILGMDATDIDIRQELYYYTTRAENYNKSKRFGLFLGNFEMGFDMANEEK